MYLCKFAHVCRTHTLLSRNGFIPAIFEQTNVPHIYAIGDVLKDKLELTPLAIQAGKLLSQRLFAGKTLNTEYMYVPTTVFTPLEYGCCGLPEEDARTIYGDQNIEVYHGYFQPLEWTVPHREDNACYGKLVVNKADNERVISFHLAGPTAGEITQGYAVAIRMRATKSDFDATIGIHPTLTENFTTMDRTKSSGEDPMVSGC
jgi:thioredoxin reductase (NADPH)